MRFQAILVYCLLHTLLLTAAMSTTTSTAGIASHSLFSNASTTIPESEKTTPARTSSVLEPMTTIPTPSSNTTNVTLPTNMTTVMLPTNMTVVTLPTKVTTVTLPTNKTTVTLPPNMTIATLPTNTTIVTLPTNTANATFPTTNTTTVTLPPNMTIATLPTNTTIVTLPTNTANATFPTTNTTTVTLPTNTANATLPTSMTTVTLPTNMTIATLPTNTTIVTLPTNTANATFPTTNTTTVTLPTNMTIATLPTNTTTVTLLTNTTNATLPTSMTTVTLPVNMTNATLPTNMITVTLPTNVTTATLPTTNTTNATLPTNATNFTLSTKVTTVTIPTNMTAVTLPTKVTTVTLPTSMTTEHENQTATMMSSKRTTTSPPAVLEVDQVFSLSYDTDWGKNTSVSRAEFDRLMGEALKPLYSSSSGYREIRVIRVYEHMQNVGRSRRAVTTSNTGVEYNVLLDSGTPLTSVIQEALFYLQVNDLKMNFNNTVVTDLQLLSYPALSVANFSCGTTIVDSAGKVHRLLDCGPNGNCTEPAGGVGYPLCECDPKNTGYRCSEAVCSQPPAAAIGSFSPDLTVYTEGMEVVYTCPQGYTNLCADAKAICTKGAWTFNYCLPFCIKVDVCSQPPSAPNGDYAPKKSTYDQDDKVVYSCKKGYRMYCSGAEATCENGVWKYSTCLPSCVDQTGDSEDSDINLYLIPICATVGGVLALGLILLTVCCVANGWCKHCRRKEDIKSRSLAEFPLERGAVGMSMYYPTDRVASRFKEDESLFRNSTTSVDDDKVTDLDDVVVTSGANNADSTEGTTPSGYKPEDREGGAVSNPTYATPAINQSAMDSTTSASVGDTTSASVGDTTTSASVGETTTSASAGNTTD